MQYLDGLNPRQREAVLHTEGPLLIVAGAGAGKTRVITHRIFHLIREGTAPHSVLAITFTNKAAKEMRDRVARLLTERPAVFREMAEDRGPRRAEAIGETRAAAGSQAPVLGVPWIGTFHALGAYILRENSRLLGIPRHFKIYDKADSLAAIKEALKRAGRDPRETEPAALLSAVSKEKGRAVRLEEFRARAADEYFPALVAEVWAEYEKILSEEKALDFDDLLLKTALLLRREKAVRERYEQQWRYLHIDEYQDTNEVQDIIAKLLAGERKNIAAVADPDQTIYTWRGAAMKNTLDFRRRYPEAKIVFLEENYRSTQTILAAANRIIAKNRLRFEKVLFTRNKEGGRLGLFTAFDESDEASFVVRKAKELIGAGTPPREIAVLFRANFQSRALEEAFLDSAVPYQVLGVRFFERREVKDVLSYIRAALHPDSLSDFRRSINAPRRGIGKVTLLKLFAGRESELPPSAREKIAAFRALLRELRNKLEAEPLSVALKWLVGASGLEAELKKGGADDEERLENIKELVTFTTRYDVSPTDSGRQGAVEQCLADAALASDQDELKEERDAVRLMTVHAAKGLEFDCVFVTGLEQGLFPHAPLETEKGLSEEKAEEERRLFYVALTRARKKVFLTSASARTVFGARQITTPSEFIFDIDNKFLETEESVAGGGRKVIYFD